jgi:hypothetical protein
VNGTDVETLADFGPDPDSPPAVAARWISELDLSERYQKKYLDRCSKIRDRYKDKPADQISNFQRRRFAVLWSNIETLKPACYARLPVPVVTRTFNDPDPVGRLASEVLERALKVNLDNYDFDQVMKCLRDDFLLFARGVPWLRYVPTFGEAPQDEAEEPLEEPEAEAEGKGGLLNGLPGALKSMLGMGGKPGEPAGVEAEGQETINEVVTDETTICDHVSLEDFGTNAARTWDEVRFGWRRTYLTREQLIKRFGKELGPKIPLDWKPEDKTSEKESEQFAKAMIYEIWDKESRKVFWISRSYPAKPLDERKDPLNLRGFFPFPKPAYGTLAGDEIIPIPDYVYYQDQAEEVDNLTLRIGLLMDALRMVGMYAGEEKLTLQQVFKKSSENQMIPVDGWAQWAEKGGIKGVVEWVPVDMVMTVLQGLFECRDKIMAQIYEVTGVSDIMRGSTEASETATAQQIKSTWGSSRVREKQKEMARVARDVMRIMGEIIAEKFGIDTLKRMTNVKLLTRAEKQQIEQWQMAVKQLEAQMQAQQQAMAAQQPPAMPGQPPQGGPPQAAPAAMPQMQPPPPPFPEEMMKLISQPAWEDVKELLENEAERMFRIDVEADSTIEPDMQQARQGATEYLTSMGALISQALPAVQAAPALGEYLGEVIKATGRLYPFGRQFEEVVDRTMTNIAKQPEQSGPSPEQVKMEAEAKRMEAEAKAHEQDLALKAAEIQDREAERKSKQEMLVAEMEAKKQERAEAAADRAADRKHKKELADGQALIKRMDVRLKEIEFELAQMESKERSEDSEARNIERETKRIGYAKATAELEEVGHRKRKAENEEGAASAVREEASSRLEQTRVLTQAVREIQAGMSQLSAQQANLVKAMTAPKRVVRDPKTNRAVGVETLVTEDR